MRRYEAHGAQVEGWSAINLLVGLTVGMAQSRNLATLSQAVNTSALSDEERRQHITDALELQLHNWAATYDGPELEAR